MNINFLQGIISYPIIGGAQSFLVKSGTFVNLQTTNGITNVGFTQKDTTYLLTESFPVTSAWGPIPASQDTWIYWNINMNTAVRSFGQTLLQPAFGTVAPSSPQIDQHWYNTQSRIMYVWSGTLWREVIRVFAAKVNGSNFTGLGSAPGAPFAGSQVGLNNISTFAGRIIFDDNGQPIRRRNGTFFTTEDQFYINGSPANTLKFEANVLTAVADETIPQFYVVMLSEFGQILLANYNALNTTFIAMAMQNGNVGDVVTMASQGTITNPAWNWTVPGAPLWVLENGALTEADPNLVDAVLYPQPKPPIARVVTPTQIFFDQGLGGQGVQVDLNAILDAIDGKVSKAGDTMTGFLTLNADPVTNLQAATKFYVDGKVSKPNTQIVYGTGTGITSELEFTWNPTTNVLQAGTVGTPATIRSPIGVASAGANLSVITGAGVGTNQAGGILALTAGAATGTGTGGNVNITAGTSPSGTNGSFRVTTNAIERFEIRGDGGWEVGGSQGTAEQVITSNGSGTPPTWQSIAGLINEPANQLVYGTGTGVTSESEFTWNPTTNVLQAGTVGTPATIRSPIGIASAGANLSVITGAGVGTNQAGGILALTAGAATGTGTGGNVNITAGTSPSGTNGVVLLTGGNGDVIQVGASINITGVGAAIGSPITISAGASTSTFGGNISITAGASTTNSGGAAALTAGAGGGASSAGGPVEVRGGTGAGTGAGGIANVTGGTGGATGIGGDAQLLGGNGGSTSGDGGPVLVQGGTPVDGNGGYITIAGSDGVGTNRIGGNVVISGGTPTGTGTPGSVQISGGNSIYSDGANSELGAGSSSYGIGGTTSLYAGTGLGGGVVNITGGFASPVGNGGQVNIAGGDTNVDGVGGTASLTGGQGAHSYPRGVGRVFFEATIPVTPTTALTIGAGNYDFQVSIDGGAPVVYTVAATGTDTMQSMAVLMQISMGTVTLTFDAPINGLDAEKELTYIDTPAASAFTAATVTEITDVTVLGGGAITTGDYWTLNSNVNAYYVWYNVDAGGGDPTPGGIGIEVDIASTDSASDVATATAAAIDADVAFIAMSAIDVVSVTNTHAGAASDAADFNAGVIVNVIQDGVSVPGDYWRLYSAGDATQYYVWYNVDGGNSDPAPGGVGLEIDILSTNSDQDVMNATRIIIDPLGDFDSAASGVAQLYVQNTVSGSTSDATAETAPVTITVGTQGTDFATSGSALVVFSPVTVGTDVPVLPADTYDFDVTIDGGLQQLSITTVGGEDYNAIAALMDAQVVGGAVTFSNIDSAFSVTSDSTGSGSTVLVGPGTFGSSGGDLFAILEAGVIVQAIGNAFRIISHTVGASPGSSIIVAPGSGAPNPDLFGAITSALTAPAVFFSLSGTNGTGGGVSILGGAGGDVDGTTAGTIRIAGGDNAALQFNTISITSATQTIVTDGYVEPTFLPGNLFQLYNTFGALDDGFYTVASTSFDGVNTSIVTVEAIPFDDFTIANLLYYGDNNAGNVTIAGGRPVGNGLAGNVLITGGQAGDGFAPPNDGSYLYIAGDVIISGGSGNAGSEANGGNVVLSGGNGATGTATNRDGGNVVISGGTPTGTGLAGNVAVGQGTTSTTRDGDHFYIPTSAGTPTGTPAIIAGLVPMVYDTTNDQLYIYSGGSWKTSGIAFT